MSAYRCGMCGGRHAVFNCPKWAGSSTNGVQTTVGPYRVTAYSASAEVVEANGNRVCQASVPWARKIADALNALNSTDGVGAAEQQRKD